MSTPEDRDIEDVLDSVTGTDTSASRAPAEAPPEAPAEAPESGADVPEGITAGGRTFANQEELTRAYEEAQRLISQTRPQEVPEEAPDPWAYVPGIDQAEIAKIEQWAIGDPIAAGSWAWENRGELPDVISKRLIAHAMTTDPAGWEMYRDSYYESRSQSIAEERTQGIRQQQVDAVSSAAESAIRAELGEAYTQYEPRIQAAIEAGEYIAPRGGFPNGIPTEAALTGIVRDIYQRLWVQDHWAELQQQPAKVNPQAATTQTKSSAAAPATDVEAALDRALGMAS